MRDVFAIAKFLFELSSSSSFRDNRGPKFTLRSPAPPRRPLAEKFLTHPQVLAYTVTFQRHSSINVRLTEGSLYNRFRIKGPPKLGFGLILRVVAKIFGGKYIHPQNCACSDIFGPGLTPRVVALCMSIAICHRRKFELVWGSPIPLPEITGNLRSRTAPFWTFDYRMEQEALLSQRDRAMLRVCQ